METALIYILICYIVMASTIMYICIRHITHMRVKLFFIDNLIVAIVGILVAIVLYAYPIWAILISTISLPIFAYLGIQIRFWRSPNRKLIAKENEIVSPADGNIIYINKIDQEQQFISIKNGKISELEEITQTSLIKKPCWQIGINMTPFDVHKNCSPIEGRIVLSKHISGTFHSLKEYISIIENERHTFIISNDKYKVGVVLIASRRVRRIDSYVQEGQYVKQGQWIGMIRFGSQVDVFLPIEAKINIDLKQQVYAKKSIIAVIE